MFLSSLCIAFILAGMQSKYILYILSLWIWSWNYFSTSGSSNAILYQPGNPHWIENLGSQDVGSVQSGNNLLGLIKAAQSQFADYSSSTGPTVTWMFEPSYCKVQRRMQGQLFQMLQRCNQQVQNCLSRSAERDPFYMGRSVALWNKEKSSIGLYKDSFWQPNQST